MERFLDYFVPERYILDIEVDKGRKYLGGKVTITGTAQAENIKFHANVTSVNEVRVNGKNWDFEHQDGVLTLFKVPRGDLEVEVGYDGSLNENMEGAYLSTYEYRGETGVDSDEESAHQSSEASASPSSDQTGVRTEVIVATQFESHYAREAFPCIDEPAAKAIFDLTITTSADDTVISNMPEAKVQSGAFRSAAARDLAPAAHGDGPAGRGARLNLSSDLKITHFQPTPRMSTYLLAWVIGKFHSKSLTNAHGTVITTYAALNQDLDSVDFANQIAAKSLEFYDDEFGVKYPLEKLDQVALPDFEAGAMENWGLVTYRESMLLASQSATRNTKKSIALTVAHELSHQWFGDLVTMAWWDDLWLNESFASVMEYYAVDHIHPEYQIFEDFFTGDCLSALRRDALAGVQSVHQDVASPAEIGTLFDPAIVYAKGARLMLMLIRLVGWGKFCRGLRDYFEKFACQNTVGDDLWQCISRYADFDVAKLMHAFIDQPGYPVITSRAASKSSEYFALPDSTFAEITQTRFLLDAPMTGTSDWPIPVVGEDMSGHYILNLSDAEFTDRLARFDTLTLEEKLRLLIDRSLICKTTLAPSASLIPLVEKCAHESSAAVWTILLTVINGLKIFFEFDTPEEKQFKSWVLHLIQPKLTEIGIISKKTDDENISRLRSILLALDFYAEDEPTIRQLADLYDPDFTKIDKEIRDDVLDAKIWCDPAICDDYIRAYRATADPEIKFDLLLALTITRDMSVLDRAMTLLTDLDTVKPQDQFHLFIFLYRNPRVQAQVFDWLRAHWDFVQKISGDKSLDNYPRYIATAIKTHAQAAAYDEFFTPLSDNPVLTRAIEIGKQEIAANLALIDEDRAGVFAAIKAVKTVKTIKTT